MQKKITCDRDNKDEKNNETSWHSREKMKTKHLHLKTNKGTCIIA